MIKNLIVLSLVVLLLIIMMLIIDTINDTGNKLLTLFVGFICTILFWHLGITLFKKFDMM